MGGKKQSNIGKKAFELLITAFMISMVGLVFFNAVLRYCFSSSIPQSEELAKYFFVWVSFLGAIIAFRDNNHVGVELLVEKLKGVPKLFVGIVGDMLMLASFVVMFVGGISFMITSSDTKGAATGIPFVLIAVSVVVAATAMAGIVLKNLYNKIKKGIKE
jgi:TRAP-type C4-dicarboxylate transport system permease small subunit